MAPSWSWLYAACSPRRAPPAAVVRHPAIVVSPVGVRQVTFGALGAGSVAPEFPEHAGRGAPVPTGKVKFWTPKGFWLHQPDERVPTSSRSRRRCRLVCMVQACGSGWVPGSSRVAKGSPAMQFARSRPGAESVQPEPARMTKPLEDMVVIVDTSSSCWTTSPTACAGPLSDKGTAHKVAGPAGLPPTSGLRLPGRRDQDDLTCSGSIDLARAALDDARQSARYGVEHLGAVMERRIAWRRTGFQLCQAYPGWNWAVNVRLSPGKRHRVSPRWSRGGATARTGLGAIMSSGSPRVTSARRRHAPFADDPLLEQASRRRGRRCGRDGALGTPASAAPRPVPRGTRTGCPAVGMTAPTVPPRRWSPWRPASCATCGFFCPRWLGCCAIFGVCANAWSPSDGTVVGLDHGCGAWQRDRHGPPRTRADS